MPTRRIVVRAVLGLAALLLLIQLIPYGRNHKDPKPTQVAMLPTAHGEQLFKQACADCHSDHTKWWWASNLAPASWLIYRDVQGGRETMNLDEWNKPQPELGDIEEAISGGGMAPLQYKLIHPSARLSSSEKRDLVAAFRELYAKNPPAKIGGGGG